MKLAEKGRYAPPPRLPSAAQRVSEAVASWPGVHARAHWLLGDEQTLDGADFYLNEEELGHIHLESEAHIMHARPIANALIQAGLARRFPWSREAVVFDIKNQSSVAHALWLFDLSYQRRLGLAEADLMARIRDYQARQLDGSTRPRAVQGSAR